MVNFFEFLSQGNFSCSSFHVEDRLCGLQVHKAFGDQNIRSATASKVFLCKLAEDERRAFVEAVNTMTVTIMTLVRRT